MNIKEVLQYSRYVIMGSRRSEIDPTSTIHVELGVGCPRCSHLLNPIEHFEEEECCHCGLKLKRLGNVLLCEATEPASKAP
jgi:hypothetical protein